jgi:Domain of unknown function (DUF4266)
MRISFFLLMIALAALTGCAQLPKVNAWEKGDLAKSIMALDADGHDQRLIQHIRVSKEGSSGGYGVGGGGCGCN